MEKEKIIATVCIVLFLVSGVNAQNLFPNPGFENYSTCPIGLSETTKCLDWNTFNTTTPDYFNCSYFGSPSVRGVAKTGTGVMGMYGQPDGPVYIENLTTVLNDTLLPGQAYQVKINVMIDSIGQGSANPNDCLDFGIYFYASSNPPAPGSACAGFTPQIQIKSSAIPNGSYREFTRVFAPQAACDAVIMGPVCSSLTSSCTIWDRMYFNLDDVSLIGMGPMEVESVALPPEEPESDHDIKIITERHERIVRLAKGNEPLTYESMWIVGQSGKVITLPAMQDFISFAHLPRGVYVLSIIDKDWKRHFFRIAI